MSQCALFPITIGRNTDDETVFIRDCFRVKIEARFECFNVSIIIINAVSLTSFEARNKTYRTLIFAVTN